MQQRNETINQITFDLNSNRHIAINKLLRDLSNFIKMIGCKKRWAMNLFSAGKLERFLTPMSFTEMLQINQTNFSLPFIISCQSRFN